MAESTYTTDDGVELHLECEGPQDAPVTLVLTHGYAQASRCWHAQRKALAAEGFRVLVWDLRGHGRSAQPPVETCTIDRVADDLAEILTHCTAGPLVLAGHSMGGMALMALAQRHHELVRGRVRAVAFVATSTSSAGLGSFGLGGTHGTSGTGLGRPGLRRTGRVVEQLASRGAARAGTGLCSVPDVLWPGHVAAGRAADGGDGGGGWFCHDGGLPADSR
ncbi:alpha/beta fold hydrolase [Luteococcus sp. Sow4_B9]|uniref:alpha/beta fold hydrolase n=1 Tax=Luteococcus sp. Sow4_B9 TaxID=3438792 RepID=UPI003F95FD82